jgi:ABC-type multidrug transport system fused ATPase/permease subunit
VLNLAFVATFLSVALRISSQIAPFVAKQTASRLESVERQTSFVLGSPFIKRFLAQIYYTETMSSRYQESWQNLDALKRFHAWRWLLQLSLFNIMTIGTIGYGAYQVASKELEVGFLVLLKWSFDQLFSVLVYIIEGYVSFINGREDAKLLREQFTTLHLNREAIALSNSFEINSAETCDIPETQDSKIWQECQLRDVLIVYTGKGLSPNNEGTNDFTNSQQGGESATTILNTNEAHTCSQHYGQRLKEESGKTQIRIPAFTLKRGEIVAITGKSGVGKTSFMEVLGRFSPFAGSYLVDGEEFPSGYKSPLTSIMITPNDPLFKATVRENLVLGRGSISDQEILDTLAIVEATSFCPSLDAIINDGSLAFSSGQEQRLRLARALLSTADILLLDEPLTGIDDNTCYKILHALKQKLQDRSRTVVLITHRPDELALAHRVVKVGDDGVVGAL